MRKIGLDFQDGSSTAKPLFPLGQIVATPGALDFCSLHKVNPGDFIKRHNGGDWGELDFHDTLVNEEAVENGGRILSSYKVGDGEVWVITEWDRSVSTVLLPSEY